MQFQPINKRRLYLRIKSKPFNLSLLKANGVQEQNQQIRQSRKRKRNKRKNNYHDYGVPCKQKQYTSENINIRKNVAETLSMVNKNKSMNWEYWKGGN